MHLSLLIFSSAVAGVPVFLQELQHYAGPSVRSQEQGPSKGHVETNHWVNPLFSNQAHVSPHHQQPTRGPANVNPSLDHFHAVHGGEKAISMSQGHSTDADWLKWAEAELMGSPKHDAHQVPLVHDPSASASSGLPSAFPSIHAHQNADSSSALTPIEAPKNKRKRKQYKQHYTLQYSETAKDRIRKAIDDMIAKYYNTSDLKFIKKQRWYHMKKLNQ